MHIQYATFLFEVDTETEFILKVFRVDESFWTHEQSCITQKVRIEKGYFFFLILFWMPLYSASIYSNLSCWNFEPLSILDLSHDPNNDCMPFIHAQFYVAWCPQKLHSEQARQTKTGTFSQFSIYFFRAYKQLWNFISWQVKFMLLFVIYLPN